MIGGREVRCGEMLDYFIKYMHIFSGDTLPQPKESITHEIFFPIFPFSVGRNYTRITSTKNLFGFFNQVFLFFSKEFFFCQNNSRPLKYHNKNQEPHQARRERGAKGLSGPAMHRAHAQCPNSQTGSY